eukprot:6949780-Pyramimonas_sp.AAC.1
MQCSVSTMRVSIVTPGTSSIGFLRLKIVSAHLLQKRAVAGKTFWASSSKPTPISGQLLYGSNRSPLSRLKVDMSSVRHLPLPPSFLLSKANMARALA